MKLINIGNRGYPEYRTEDYRFTAKWAERQGARSTYNVTDIRTGKTLRADNLNEVKETIRDMIIAGHVGSEPALMINDLLYDVHVTNRFSGEPPVWEVCERRITELRVDGFALAGIGRLPWGSFGVHYHRTRDAALTMFIERNRNTIDTAREEISEAERAIAWADGLSNTPGQRNRR